MGCFSGERVLSPATTNDVVDENVLSTFRDVFESDFSKEAISAALKVLPKRLVSAGVILRMLYEMTVDFGHEWNRPVPALTSQVSTSSAASVGSATMFSFSK